jgi:hypothetical protein
MGHRNWSAELGRFISRDPIGFAGGLNLFGSHGVSPVTMVDPSGLANDLILHLPQADVDALNLNLGTSITREMIRSDIESELRRYTGCNDIDVKLRDYHLPDGGGALPLDSQGRFQLNLHLATGRLPFLPPGESELSYPVGRTNPTRARVSIGDVLMTAISDGGYGPGTTEISNYARNTILHEAIWHGVSKQGPEHSAPGDLSGPYPDMAKFGASILSFPQSGSPIIDMVRRRVKNNLGCP